MVHYAVIDSDEPYSGSRYHGYSGKWYRDSCKPYRPSAGYNTQNVFGNYKDGELDGMLIIFNPMIFYATQKPEAYAMVFYANGKLNGPVGTWNIDTGQPYKYGNYVNDQKDGTWTDIIYKKAADGFSDTEEVVAYMKESFKAHVRDGAYGEWLADGTPIGGQGNYVNGKREGAWKWYGIYRNNRNMQTSQCTCEGSFVNDYVSGTVSCYDTNRNLLCQITNGIRTCESDTEYGNFCEHYYAYPDATMECLRNPPF